MVSVKPDGVRVAGKWNLFNVVTRWNLSVESSEIFLRCGKVDVGGLTLPWSVVKGMILAAIGEALKGRRGLRVSGDDVIIHLGDILADYGLTLDARWSGLRTYDGWLVLEARPMMQDAPSGQSLTLLQDRLSQRLTEARGV
jgi:hypothetical protein